MYLFHVITAVAFRTIDLGRHLGEPRRTIVGAAALTGRLDGGSVLFSLDTFVFAASAREDALLQWLDVQLADDRVPLAGYNLGETCALLEELEYSQYSSGLHALGGRARRTIIDLRSHQPDGKPLPFDVVCERRGMPRAHLPEASGFTAWMTGQPEPIRHALELNVISTWRMTMGGFAPPGPVRDEMNRHIDRHLVRWLRRATFPAARLHLASIAAARA